MCNLSLRDIIFLNNFLFNKILLSILYILDVFMGVRYVIIIIVFFFDGVYFSCGGGVRIVLDNIKVG